MANWVRRVSIGLASVVAAGCSGSGGGDQQVQFYSRPPIDVGTDAAETPVASTPVEAPTTTPPPAPPDGVVYLTFDDGPSPHTQPVLDVLERHGVKATFFVLGRNIAGKEPLLADIRARGHAIGNHTWNHEDLRQQSEWGVYEELSKTNEAITAATGQPPGCVRPPYGYLSDHVRAGIAALDMSVELWTIETFDWKGSASVASVLEKLNTAADGSIVIMHDGGGDQSHTMQALDQWLSANEGRFEFRTLPTC